MKNILSIIFNRNMSVAIAAFMLVLSSLSYAQDKLDVNAKPEPLPESQFNFPEYYEDMLEHGVKTFIIEDHEQPVFSFSLMLAGGSSMDGDKPGLAELTAGMLMKGAEGMSALQIADKLDGMGAYLDVDVTVDAITINGFCLKKHMDEVLEIFRKIVLHPDFNDKELEKLKIRTIGGIKQERAVPARLAGKLMRKVIYGPEHPYARQETEISIMSITMDDIKAYYKKWFRPDNASLAIIGDFSKYDIMGKFNTLLTKWEKPGGSIIIDVPKPDPMPVGVYFISRPGSVQSSVVVGSGAMPYNSAEYTIMKLASNVIAGGMAGRLFKTLREKHSYTYTPYGFVSSDKYANRFQCGADVRTSVTDSAINVIKEQIGLLATRAADNEELQNVKKYVTGSYKMAFEKPETVAGIIQKSWLNDITIDRAKTYTKTIMDIGPYILKDIAEKYMNPNNLSIVVVGDPSIFPVLEKFGKVYQYGQDLNPEKYEKISITAAELMEEYSNAMGGSDNLKAVSSIVADGSIEMNTNGYIEEGTIKKYQKSPDKMLQIMDLGVLNIKSISNGKDVWMGNNKLFGDEKQVSLFEYSMFNWSTILAREFKAKVLGKRNGQIALEVNAEFDYSATLFFNEDTYLLEKVEKVVNVQGKKYPITQKYKSYKLYDNVQLPTLIETQMPMFITTENLNYKLNEAIDDAMFSAE